MSRLSKWLPTREGSSTVTDKEVKQHKGEVIVSSETMSKENHKHVESEEFHESTCAGCGEQWGRDGWEKRTSVGDGWGGSAHYDCPSEDCDGTLTMHF